MHPLRIILVALIVLVATSSTPTRSQATGVFINVGKELRWDVHTLHDALAMAFSADTIVLHPGTYNECVTVTGLIRLTIVAKKGAVLDATGCGTAITIADAGGTMLKNLTITGATTQGILVQAAASDTLIQKSTITDPAMDPASSVLQVGINVAGATDTTIDGVTIRGATVAGIVVTDASGAVLQKNKISDGTGAGVRLDLAQTAMVERNRLENLLAPAIWLFHEGGQGATGGATNSVVASNKIVASPGGGIVVAGTGNTIAKNKIDPVGAAGIEALSTGGSSTYSGNTIVTPTGGAGILAGGTADTFEKNTVKQPAHDGIVVTGDDNILTGCKVSQAAGDGFVVDALASGNDFTSCASTKAGVDGFHVDGTTNTFTKVKASGSIGLDLNDSAGAATTNLYTDCKFKTSSVP